MNYTDVITKAVEDYRQSRNLTGTKCAEMIGIKQPMYSMKVRGVKPWTHRDLDRLTALGIIEIKAGERDEAL